ncbi:MAG: hypothetical protein OHK0012_21520 [Synechococcales cyanobacterium]
MKRFLRSPTQGFTLAELLGGVIASTIFLAGTTGIVVQLLIADRREAARTETQAEMQAALNFIADDLRQAVYIYGDEFTGTNFTTFTARTSAPDGIPDLNQILSPSTTVAAGGLDLIPKSGSTAFPDRPILAFWRVSTLSQDCRPTTTVTPDPTPPTPLPTDTTVAAKNSFRSTGVAFELVVYYLRWNNHNPPSSDTVELTWRNQGPARIHRRVYRPFINGDCDTSSTFGSDLNESYVAPDPPFFSRWPFDTSTPEKIVTITGTEIAATSGGVTAIRAGNLGGGGTGNRQGFTPNTVVVSYVDRSNVTVTCPANYSLGSSFSRIGFYACVRIKDTQNNPSLAQDVYLYLMGNAYNRAGFAPANSPPAFDCGANGDPGYCPQVSTQVFARTYFDRSPR